MSGNWTKGWDQVFPCESWSENCEWYWAIAIWSFGDTYILYLGQEKTLLILQTSQKISKFSSRKEDVHVHSPTILGQSVKWRKIINKKGEYNGEYNASNLCNQLKNHNFI